MILFLGSGRFGVWTFGFFHGNNVGMGLFSSLIFPAHCTDECWLSQQKYAPVKFSSATHLAGLNPMGTYNTVLQYPCFGCIGSCSQEHNRCGLVLYL